MPEEYYDEDGFRLSFESDTDPEEKQYFMRSFPNVSKIAERKIHCTSCQVHIGTAPVSVTVIRMHPVLRVTHCRTCHAFYNSGEFDKGEDGSELYCRWCGQGGEVYCCSNCPYVFCKSCIMKNLSRSCVHDIARNENWKCFGCAPQIMWHLRAQHWALMNFIEKQKKNIKMQHDPTNIDKLLRQDLTTCCSGKGSLRVKSNQTLAAAGSKKQTKRAEEEDEADNVPLAKTRKVGVEESGSKKDSTLKPMVMIPPISPALLGKEKESTSSPTPSTKSQKKQKHKAASAPEETEQQSPQAPPAKKSKKGNNEVVCTPDIMSMINQMEEVRTPAAISTPSNAASAAFALGAPHSIPENLNTGPATSSPGPRVQTPAQVPPGTPKPKAILHRSLPRNLMVRLGPKEAPSSPAIAQANQVADGTSQLMRVSPTAAGRQMITPPVYTTVNGFRIDLHTAAQQGTFRLPNGKLIQVRKQTADPPAPTVGSSEIAPDLLTTHSMEQHANRAPLAANSQANNQGFMVRPAAPQVYTSLLQQQPPSSPMFPTVQQTLSYTPQQTHPIQQQHQQQQHQQQMQHQLAQQALQHLAAGVHPQSMQLQQQQQQQQQHLQNQLSQQILQRQRGRPAQIQRSKPQKQAQRQQPSQRAQSYAQPARPVQVALQSTGGQYAPRVVAHRQNQQQMVQLAPQPPAASPQTQLPLLQMLRGLVDAPHEDSPVGSGLKDLEGMLLGFVEACNHINIKIHTLTQSNSFKTIRNTRDLKELFIHVSYLLTYGVGRFNTLHEGCVEAVKKMGFTKPSDFVMMGEKVNNRNPEDSEDDDDCEIVEENTTVIQVDSDDEAAAGGGTSNTARRANAPQDSPMPSNTGRDEPIATSSDQQALPNESTVPGELNTSVDERTNNSAIASPETGASKELAADASQQKESLETLQESLPEGEMQDKSDKDPTENMVEKDTIEEIVSGQDEAREPTLVVEPVGEEKSKSDQTPMEASSDNETVEGSKQPEIAESVELLSESEEEEPTKSNPESSDGGNGTVETGSMESSNSEGENGTKSDQTPMEVSLEEESIETAEKSIEIQDLLESADAEGKTNTKSDKMPMESSVQKETVETAKQMEVTGSMDSLESDRENQTNPDQTLTKPSLEQETIEIAEDNDKMNLSKPVDSEDENHSKSDLMESSVQKETIEPAKQNEVTESMESLETVANNNTNSDQIPTETSLEEENIEPAKQSDQTETEVGLKEATTESFVGKEGEEEELDSGAKGELPNNSNELVLEPVSEGETSTAGGNGSLKEQSVEPMEVSESQAENPDDADKVCLADDMENRSSDDVLNESTAELMEVSPSDQEQLGIVPPKPCLDKGMEEDSNASTLGSWESVENIVEDGEHVKKRESQRNANANDTAKCTKPDESVQPPDFITEEKGAATGNVTNVEEDVKTMESTHTTCSSLVKNANSNHEAAYDDLSVSNKVQDSKVDRDDGSRGGSTSVVGDEFNDRDLAAALDDSVKQATILVDENSKANDERGGSSEQKASISEEELSSEDNILENAADSLIDTSIEEVEQEQQSKGDGSDEEVINLMEASNNTDLNEGCSEMNFLEEESKIPERDSQQAATILLDDTVEQSVSGSSSFAQKDSLHDILLDDLSSISSSSNDEYADAATETTNAKEKDVEKMAQPSTSVVTNNEAQEISPNALERPVEDPATIGTGTASARRRTSFDHPREP